MKRIAGIAVMGALALGAGLISCNGSKSPTAPDPTPTPSGCFDSMGHTCTPTETSTPTATWTPGPFSVSAPTTLSTGDYPFTSVDVASGQTLYISGAVTLDVSGYFNLPSGATIIGDGTGYAAKNGPGTSALYGGGGHGGAGGDSGHGSDAGPANDTAADPTMMGSGGGGLEGGAGGGLLRVNVLSGPATLDGFISMNGTAGTNGSGATGSPGKPGNGGGAGGTVYVQADTIVFNGGTLEADGGIGGDGGHSATGSSYSNSTGGDGAGGGGGGIILLMYHTTLSGTGSTSVTAGTGGLAGTGNTNGTPGAAGAAGSSGQATY